MITRRELLCRCANGFGSLALASLIAEESARAAADDPLLPKPPHFPARAKSVIFLFMEGGPSQMDSFDPKPAAGNDYCGPLNNPLATNADGIRIGELLPLLAKQADKFSLIRSMTHGDNGHETAAYLTQTGRRPGDHGKCGRPRPRSRVDGPGGPE